ncbi:hypothetical protein AcW1_008363 [Taiwanofungus camphoratus]|nr:hypothetical protein AcW1_008363 [Antrodia cinnamomea]
MAPQIRSIHQNFVDEDCPPIQVRIMLESSLTVDIIHDFIGLPSSDCSQSRRVGISPAYVPSGRLSAIGIATDYKVLIVQFHSKEKSETAKRGREILQSELLCHPDSIIVAFDLAPLALSLYYDHRIRMLNGINFQSACSGRSNSTPLSAIEFAVGDQVPIHKENIGAAFQDTLDWDPSQTTTLALRAWIATYLSHFGDMEERFRSVERVNTQKFSEMQLDVIAQMARGDQRLDMKKPLSTSHEFSTSHSHHHRVEMESTRYQTRLRKSHNINMAVRDASGMEYTVHGRTDDILGRSAKIEADTSLDGKTILSVTTVGGHKPTNLENQKAATLLHVLQGTLDLFNNPFLKFIWFPEDNFEWPDTFISQSSIPPVLSTYPLNESQLQAVECMLSNTNTTRITMIQGPPGTGKTTVIATYVVSAVSAGVKGIWLLAQSNNAVKNIAEKLASVGFSEWKLLVSVDFHANWHEHLYHRVYKNMIRSDEFKGAEEQLLGCPVVLCTLSMLANPRIKTFTNVVPITTVVIDEASQIALSDYIPLLSTISSIQKLCFIGDDKQLPPYGQEEVEELKSVFEVSHLHSSAIFLNMQYRMPPQIGDFISDQVYDGQLQSNPDHLIGHSLASCYFVDVEGCEKHYEKSWVNECERLAVLKIAARLQDQDKSYKIITPYDAQRSALEDDMKKYGLKWQNKCFNIDSFQGNEDDYIVISLVRSKDLGFLTDMRRTNVMLSRCKCGMYICSSWNFLYGVASDTLVGRMAAAWDDEAWLSIEHLETGKF